MRFTIRDGLTYDDVLLAPKHSKIRTRSKVSLDCNIYRNYFNFPVIPANMKTVINQEVALAILEVGGLVILHRFMSFEEQLALHKQICETAKLPNTGNGQPSYHVAISVGVQDDDFKNIEQVLVDQKKNDNDNCIRLVCVDVAHGDSERCEAMVKHIREVSGTGQRGPEVSIIAGNVATGEGAMRLWNAGATAVKVGIGPGSLCSTRIETGNGVPQLTALIDVANARDSYRHNRENTFAYMHIIADGGIKSAGDCVKALCFADMVMAGNLFAGSDESPGETFVHAGISYKKYEGSSTHKSNHVEGVKAMVNAKGPVRDVIRKLSEGIRSGCSYQGAKSLIDLRKEPEFIRISNAGLHESHPHSVTVIT